MQVNRTCAHGHPAISIPVEGQDGWFVDVVANCSRCEQVGTAYKRGAPPPCTPALRQQQIEELAADVAPMEAKESHAEPSPEPPVDLKAEERPVAPRKAARRRSGPESCPTCGRPVVAGAPHDLPTIRKALTAALKAVDDLLLSEKREQEALKELDKGS